MSLERDGVIRHGPDKATGVGSEIGAYLVAPVHIEHSTPKTGDQLRGRNRISAIQTRFTVGLSGVSKVSPLLWCPPSHAHGIQSHFGFAINVLGSVSSSADQ